MRSRIPLLAAVLLAAIAVYAQSDEKIAFAPDAIVWTDAPPSMPAGSKTAVLEGNPRGDGMFTMRVRVPGGSILQPHWHPRHERVTVLSGSVELGFGNVADPRIVTRYGAGSFYVNPPRAMHFLFFPEDTELQMTGLGPWEIKTADIHPRTGPKATANVIVKKISPASGAELTPETELVAEVDYSIVGFRPETFFLSFQFESVEPNRTFNAASAVLSEINGQPPAPPLDEKLTTARGTTTVRQPMERVLSHKMLKRPIRVRVYMHEENSDRTSHVAGMSDWIEYR